MANVLICGGGFGGLAAAHELRRLLPDEHEITLVSRDDRFFMGFAKLWDLAGARPLTEGTRSLERLERHGIRFVNAGIERIDPERRSVVTTEGELSGDALLVALGAGDHPGHVGQLKGAAHNLYDAAALPAIREALSRVREGRMLVLIMGPLFKCPPAPYEATLLVDEYLHTLGTRDGIDMAVATPQPLTLPAAGPDASKFLADVLGERGVDVLTGRKLERVDADRQVVSFDGGEEIDYRLLLAVPQNVPPSVVRESPLAADSGWIEPDRRTLGTAFERVYAVGDCTHIPVGKRALPKAGVFAEAQGLVAARNIAAELIGGEGDTFDGHGFCFLELPGKRVAYVEGNFYAEPDPDVSMSPPDEASFAAKESFERERLDAWLG